MSRSDPAKLAVFSAEKLIRDRGITTLPIDPFAIASERGIEVVKKPASSAGVSGMLIRVGQAYGIAYATHIDSEGFQRYCVGHELGHYFLPGHIEAVLADGDVHESRAGFVSSDRYEIEADHFAAGLLMPKQLFKPALDRAGEGMAAVLSLADLCVTSLPATAIRLTQCTRDPVAVIVSIGSKIDYCFMSDELKELDGIDWIRKRQAVPSGTPTYLFNQDASNVAGARRVEGSSNLQEWFGGHRRIEVKEDVKGLGSYGKTLTMLYGFELPEPEDEEEEEALIESWTPRFRR